MEDVNANTARSRCGWAKLRECIELLNRKRFPLRLKWAVYTRQFILAEKHKMSECLK